MSKIALSSNTTGTATFTIASPATNTNRTLTIPDATTTLVGTDATQILSNKFFLDTNTVIVSTPTGTARIDVGAGRTGDGPAFIDLVGDTTYSDYGARIIRQGTSAGASTLTHRGTGNLEITAEDAAPIVFKTTNTERMRIDASGNLLFNSGFGSVAVAYGCRAWVNFNGTGTVAIRGSGNVSSITDNGVGLYTVNFATAMPDTNFTVAGSGGDYTTGTALLYVQERNSPSLRTVNSIAISTGFMNSGSAALQDNVTNMVTVFR